MEGRCCFFSEEEDHFPPGYCPLVVSWFHLLLCCCLAHAILRTSYHATGQQVLSHQCAFTPKEPCFHEIKWRCNMCCSNKQNSSQTFFCDGRCVSPTRKQPGNCACFCLALALPLDGFAQGLYFLPAGALKHKKRRVFLPYLKHPTMLFTMGISSPKMELWSHIVHS